MDGVKRVKGGAQMRRGARRRDTGERRWVALWLALTMTVNMLVPAYMAAGAMAGFGPGTALSDGGSTIVLCALNGIRIVKLDADGNPAEKKKGEGSKECPACRMGVAGLATPQFQLSFFVRPNAVQRFVPWRNGNMVAFAPETQPSSPRAPPFFA